MLYDPKWEIQTKAEPLTLGHFIEWLQTHDPDKEYEFRNCKGMCLVGQYMTSIGRSWDGPGDGPLNEYGVVCRTLFGGDGPCRIEQSVAQDTPHTFGAALERARAVAQSRS